jgi:hypothetical protein
LSQVSNGAVHHEMNQILPVRVRPRTEVAARIPIFFREYVARAIR